MDFHNAQRCVLLGREIKAQQELASEAQTKLLEKYGTADTDLPGQYKIPEDKRAEYIAEMEKFSKHKFSVKVAPLDAESISEKLEFSPQDLILLEDVLAPLGLEETGEIKEGKKAQPEVATH